MVTGFCVIKDCVAQILRRHPDAWTAVKLLGPVLAESVEKTIFAQPETSAVQPAYQVSNQSPVFERLTNSFSVSSGNLSDWSLYVYRRPAMIDDISGVNSVCPVGYACINNQCCGPPSAANSINSLITCSQLDSNGPCLSDNTCPEPGFNCDLTNQWCCPNIVGDPIGPCIRGEGNTRLCPGKENNRHNLSCDFRRICLFGSRRRSMLST